MTIDNAAKVLFTAVHVVKKHISVMSEYKWTKKSKAEKVGYTVITDIRKQGEAYSFRHLPRKRQYLKCAKLGGMPHIDVPARMGANEG